MKLFFMSERLTSNMIKTSGGYHCEMPVESLLVLWAVFRSISCHDDCRLHGEDAIKVEDDNRILKDKKIV